MKKIYVLLILLSTPKALISQQIQYQDSGKKQIKEIFTPSPTGFVYCSTEGKKKSKVFMVTNENHATVSFTNINNKEKTNIFYLLGGDLVTQGKRGKRKSINLNNLELILFPEIQLQNFIKNKNLTNMSYTTIRLKDLKPFTVTATKIVLLADEPKNQTKVEIIFDNISPKLLRFVYYFDESGIAFKKEGYFIRAKKPQLNLIKK